MIGLNLAYHHSRSNYYEKLNLRFHDPLSSEVLHLLYCGLHLPIEVRALSHPSIFLAKHRPLLARLAHDFYCQVLSTEKFNIQPRRNGFVLTRMRITILLWSRHTVYGLGYITTIFNGRFRYSVPCLSTFPPRSS